MGVDPASLILAGTLISAGTSAISGIRQKRAADANAGVLKQQAEASDEASASNVSRHRSDIRRRLASQIAELNGVGAQIGSGTALDIAENAGRTSKLEELDLTTAGEDRRRGLLFDAQTRRSQGKNARAGGFLGAAAHTIAGAGKWDHLRGAA